MSDNFDTGWIKIFRSVTSHWLWPKKQPLTRLEAWMLILIETNYSDEVSLISGDFVKCKRGEKLYSLDTWADKFNWSKSRVRRFFKLLVDDSMIELIPCQGTTHLRVLNYETYQGERNASDTPSDTAAIPNRRKKEGKKDKQPAKKVEVFDFKKSLIEIGVEPKVVDSWLIVRKTKRAVNTEIAFNRVNNEINKTNLSANECITMCVENSWHGFHARYLDSTKKESGNLIRR